jgi:uncharacterized protein YjbJ (UPF0337 family)
LAFANATWGTLELWAVFSKARFLMNGGSKMNTDQMKGNWKQFVGKAKEKWGKLTDNDWQVVEGKRDQLAGKIQERYGIARDEAERQIAELEKSHERL